MALREHVIPNESVNYVKLKDYPDGEEIEVVGAGIREGLRYGDIPYFITAEGDELSLPTRYLKYISGILTDESALDEINSGVTIIKGSRKTITGGTTPTFVFK